MPMTTLDVPLGTHNPHQRERCNPGRPASSTVAISGAAGDRALLVTAYALILPSRTAGSEVDSAPNVTSIWPAIRSCSTREPPRYGTYWTCIPVNFWSNRPLACDGLPGPLVPKDNGAKVVSHGRYVAFQMAEVAIPR